MKIEIPEYHSTDKCAAVRTTPKKYRGIPAYRYFYPALLTKAFTVVRSGMLYLEPGTILMYQ